jgi:ATP phosphoribosyltransferase regulatory subunit
MKINRILPNGFYDLVGQDAKKHYEYTKLIIDNFINQDYELIKTSIIEYTENYNENDLKKIFKFVDPITREQIFYRNDITMQIANYVSSKSDFDNNKIHKFCYYGDIINLNNDTAFSYRQQTQVGCEIIGNNEIQSIYKIIDDNLRILKNIGMMKIFISLPDFLGMFLKSINQIDNNDLKIAIIDKNISSIKKHDDKYYDLISEIVLNNFNYCDLFDKIIFTINKDDLTEQLNMAKDIKNFIENNYSNIDIYFDLFGDNNFSYHNKIAFDIYINNLMNPIAKGGCYVINKGQEKIDAVGSTIYLNNLQKI